LEAGGNLATVKTNTDSLITAGGGGYVRQDSTATIAKETGGNLATIKTNTDDVTIAETRILVTLTLQSTAYPVTLPNNLLSYEVKASQSRDFYIASTEAGLTTNYDIIKSGTAHGSNWAKGYKFANGTTLFFKDTANAGTILCIKCTVSQ
jgi:hypothetical protein